MYNKKVLRDALNKLDSAKPRAQQKDRVINDKLLPFISTEGYKQGPPPEGMHYRILGDTIYNPTPYNIRAIGSNGEEDIIAAGDTSNRTFQGADYVDEYQAAYGGDISIPKLTKAQKGKTQKYNEYNQNVRYKQIYEPVVEKITNSDLIMNNWEKYPNYNTGWMEYILSGPSKDRNMPPETPLLKEMQQKILALPSSEIDKLLKVNWSGAGLPTIMYNRPSNVSIKDMWKYYNHLNYLKDQGYTLEDGGEYIDIEATDAEIDELRKGGYIVKEHPSLPKKKGSKAYSKSLMATNQLFAQNPLTKKAKSKKNKIFDPNAKQFEKGGFQDDIDKHRDLLRDWTYGASIGMLHKAQTGKNFRRTYDPLLDYQPQVSESTKPKNVPSVDKKVLDKAVAQKTAERKAVATAIKKSPTLTEKQKTEILMSPQKLDENVHLAYQKEPDTVKESTPQSTAGRVWDIVTNPQAAFEYSIRTGDVSNMPYNYNAMRMAGIDPSAGGGSNLVGNALNMTTNLFDAGDKVVRNIGEGNYSTAALEALRFLPGARVTTGLGKRLNTESGLLSNAYKINPWAFKPNPEAYYRGIGKEGLDDALQSGAFRQAGFDNKNYNNYKEVWYATGNRGFAKAKDFSKDYIAEVPRKAFPETGDQFFGSALIPTRGTKKHIPITEGKILQKDWLKGYKEVPVELPGSPNTFTRSGLGGMDMSRYEIKNPDYFTQLLNTYDNKSLSPSNKKFYKDLIASVKKQNGLVTERQYNELQRLKSGNFDFGKRGYGQSSTQQTASSSKPKSDIDWAKWNPDTPNYPELIDEYNAIEEASKANGTWMKNPDGTPYVPSKEALEKGLGEQEFIIKQSKRFKEAYPEGYETMHRGYHYDNFEEAALQNPEGRSIFGADYASAYHYAGNKPENVYTVIYPKSKNSLEFQDAGSWREIGVDPDLGIQNTWEGKPGAFRSGFYKDPVTGQYTRGQYVSTDDLASHLEKNKMDYAKIKNLFDGIQTDYVTILNQRPGNYAKKLVGNLGFFDLKNPNTLKGLLPYLGAGYLGYKGLNSSLEQEDGGYIETQLTQKEIDEYRKGGYIVDELD